MVATDPVTLTQQTLKLAPQLGPWTDAIFKGFEKQSPEERAVSAERLLSAMATAEAKQAPAESVESNTTFTPPQGPSLH